MSAMKWAKVATLSTGAAAAVVLFVPHPLAGRKDFGRDNSQTRIQRASLNLSYRHLWMALRDHGGWELACIHRCMIIPLCSNIAGSNTHAGQVMSRKRCVQVCTRTLSGPECATSIPRGLTTWHYGSQNTNWRPSTVSFMPCLFFRENKMNNKEQKNMCVLRLVAFLHIKKQWKRF